MRGRLIPGHAQPGARHVYVGHCMCQHCRGRPVEACPHLEQEAIDGQDTPSVTIFAVSGDVVLMVGLVGGQVRVEDERRPRARVMRVAHDTVPRSMQVGVRGRGKPDEEGQRQQARHQSAQHD